MKNNKSLSAAMTLFLAAVAAVALGGCATTQATTQAAPREETRAPAPRGNALAFPTGDRATSAVLLEKRFPVQIFQGREFTYDLVVTNLTGFTLEDVRINETLPENYTLSSSTPYEAVSSGDQVVWTIPSLAPHNSVTITVSGVAHSGSNFATCAEVTYRSVLCATAPIVSPGLELGVSLASVTDICSTTPITYTVTNTGSATLNNVSITPAIPSGLQVVGAAPSFTVNQLTPGASQSFTVNVKPAASGEYEVLPTASASEGVSASATASTTTLAPELAASASSPDQVLIVHTITYDVGVANLGQAAVGATTVSATLPANAEFISATGGGVVQSGSVVWSVSGLSPEGAANYSFTVKPRGAGDYSTNVTVRNDCAGSASAHSTTSVVGIPALLLEVIDQNDPVAVGDNVVYEIAITNQGSAPAHNVTIKVELEDNQTYLTSSGNTPSSVSGRTVNFSPISSIPVGGKAVYHVTVRTTAAGDTRFHVSMTADELGRPVQETEATNVY